MAKSPSSGKKKVFVEMTNDIVKYMSSFNRLTENVMN
jgi:hypothetical protein